ncbi:MAG: hypothetical protein IJ389_05220 [Clostridia bacterium]|nr:hypothetical protein [Clostridia bacterium]
MKKIALMCAVLLLCTSCANAGGGDIIDEVSDIVSDMLPDGAEEYTLQLGVFQSHNASEGKAKFASTYACVICDGDGKIVSCSFDATEDTLSVDGGIAETGGEYLSKRDRGNDYGMKAASGIGREWYEQADHFAENIIGYTIDEVIDMENGDADLTSGCTIDTDPFKAALEASDKDSMKKEFTAANEPAASLAVVSNDEGSKNASDTNDGIAALSSTYAAVALDGGRILASMTEATETKVYFDASGLIIEISKRPGKREQGASYGMKPASDIGLEWYEQADNFEEYTVGMNGDQVAAIGTNDGRPADDDLRSGCTVKVNEFIAAISKAANRQG